MRGQRNHIIVASLTSRLGKLLVPVVIGESTRASQVTTLQDQPRVSRCINYYFNVPVCARHLTNRKKTLKSCQTLNVNSLVAGQLQKRGLSPVIVQQAKPLKYVKDVSCVDQLSFVQNVRKVPVVALDLLIGARLHQFLETKESSKKATLSPSGSDQI